MGGIEEELRSFFNSSLVGGEWLTSRFDSKKEQRYQLNRMGLGGPQIRFGSFGKEIIFFLVQRFEPRPIKLAA
jgi:hypothetical protein